MPASSIDMFYIQNDAKNNFHAMRPVPICNETDNHQLLGHSHNVHISRNCYYGYHDAKSSGNSSESTDYEMKEVPHENIKGPLEINTKKRCADVSAYPRSKRMREEGMVPSTSTHNPSLLRPTHNNPDISRCLMVHMI